jgi:tRNA(Ile)-lysidine synthase
LKSKIDDFTYNRTLLLESEKAIVTQLLCSEFYEYSDLILDNKKANNLYDLLSDGGRLQIYGDIFAEVKKNYIRFFRIDNADFTDEIEIVSFPFESVFSDYLISLEKITDNSKIVNHLCMGDMIDCNTLSGKLVLRTRKAGDKFTFSKRNVSKSLKKLFTEENIPIEIRDKIPVLSDDNGVVWVYGFGVTKRNCADKHSDNIILVRGKNNDR